MSPAEGLAIAASFREGLIDGDDVAILCTARLLADIVRERLTEQGKPTVCPSGHDLTVYGTVFPGRPRRVVCRECVRISKAAYYTRKKAA